MEYYVVPSDKYYILIIEYSGNTNNDDLIRDTYDFYKRLIEKQYLDDTKTTIFGYILHARKTTKCLCFCYGEDIDIFDEKITTKIVKTALISAPDHLTVIIHEDNLINTLTGPFSVNDLNIYFP